MLLALTIASQYISHGGWIGIVVSCGIPVLYFVEYFLYPSNNNPNNIYTYIGAAIIFTCVIALGLQNLWNEIRKQKQQNSETNNYPQIIKIIPNNKNDNNNKDHSG